jgi:hypothetical protein
MLWQAAREEYDALTPAQRQAKKMDDMRCACVLAEMHAFFLLFMCLFRRVVESASSWAPHSSLVQPQCVWMHACRHSFLNWTSPRAYSTGYLPARNRCILLEVDSFSFFPNHTFDCYDAIDISFTHHPHIQDQFKQYGVALTSKLSLYAVINYS